MSCIAEDMGVPHTPLLAEELVLLALVVAQEGLFDATSLAEEAGCAEL